MPANLPWGVIITTIVGGLFGWLTGGIGGLILGLLGGVGIGGGLQYMTEQERDAAAQQPGQQPAQGNGKDGQAKAQEKVLTPEKKAEQAAATAKGWGTKAWEWVKDTHNWLKFGSPDEANNQGTGALRQGAVNAGDVWVGLSGLWGAAKGIVAGNRFFGKTPTGRVANSVVGGVKGMLWDSWRPIRWAANEGIVRANSLLERVTGTQSAPQGKVPSGANGPLIIEQLVGDGVRAAMPEMPKSPNRGINIREADSLGGVSRGQLEADIQKTMDWLTKDGKGSVDGAKPTPEQAQAAKALTKQDIKTLAEEYVAQKGTAQNDQGFLAKRAAELGRARLNSKPGAPNVAAEKPVPQKNNRGVGVAMNSLALANGLMALSSDPQNAPLLVKIQVGAAGTGLTAEVLSMLSGRPGFAYVGRGAGAAGMAIMAPLEFAGAIDAFKKEDYFTGTRKLASGTSGTLMLASELLSLSRSARMARYAAITGTTAGWGSVACMAVESGVMVSEINQLDNSIVAQGQSINTTIRDAAMPKVNQSYNDYVGRNKDLYPWQRAYPSVAEYGIKDEKGKTIGGLGAVTQIYKQCFDDYRTAFKDPNEPTPDELHKAIYKLKPHIRELKKPLPDYDYDRWDAYGAALSSGKQDRITRSGIYRMQLHILDAATIELEGNKDGMVRVMTRDGTTVDVPSFKKRYEEISKLKQSYEAQSKALTMEIKTESELKAKYEKASKEVDEAYRKKLGDVYQYDPEYKAVKKQLEAEQKADEAELTKNHKVRSDLQKLRADVRALYVDSGPAQDPRVTKAEERIRIVDEWLTKNRGGLTDNSWGSITLTIKDMMDHIPKSEWVYQDGGVEAMKKMVEKFVEHNPEKELSVSHFALSKKQRKEWLGAVANSECPNPTLGALRQQWEKKVDDHRDYGESNLHREYERDVEHLGRMYEKLLGGRIQNMPGYENLNEAHGKLAKDFEKRPDDKAIEQMLLEVDTARLSLVSVNLYDRRQQVVKGVHDDDEKNDKIVAETKDWIAALKPDYKKSLIQKMDQDARLKELAQNYGDLKSKYEENHKEYSAAKNLDAIKKDFADILALIEKSHADPAKHKQEVQQAREQLSNIPPERIKQFRHAQAKLQSAENGELIGWMKVQVARRAYAQHYHSLVGDVLREQNKKQQPDQNKQTSAADATRGDTFAMNTGDLGQLTPSTPAAPKQGGKQANNPASSA